MSRIARLTIPGVVHHVISRFVDREWFFASDAEREHYLRLLAQAMSESDWRCLAYCLMSNHVHLAMVAGHQDLESWSKRVHSPFAVWLNAQRGRLGPVFADRPAAHALPRHREGEVIAYVHNNPVRAKVVATARLSTWSSQRAYLGLAPQPQWLHVREGLERSGCADDPAAFEQIVGGLVGAPFELPDLARVREELRRNGPYEPATPTLSDPNEIPVVQRAFLRVPPTPTEVLDAVASVAGVHSTALCRRFARGRIASVKRVFIHAAVRLGIPVSQAADAVNVSRQRGSIVAQAPLSSDDVAMLEAAVARLTSAAP
jgi:hypothetical protein